MYKDKNNICKQYLTFIFLFKSIIDNISKIINAMNNITYLYTSKFPNVHLYIIYIISNKKPKTTIC